MKKAISIMLTFAFAMLLSLPALADENFEEPMDPAFNQEVDQGPAPVVDGARASCQPLADACYRAGFAPTGKKGKGMFERCMKPLMSGRVMRMVSTTPEAVQSCRDALKQAR